MSDQGDTSYVDADGVVDRDRLILEHVPLLHYIVGRMVLDVPGSVDRDDLLGWGMLGLIGAADTWDPGRGLKFSTFAYPRIRGSILDELRRMDFLPRGRRDKVRQLERAFSELEQAHGTPPTPEELAARLEIELDEVDEIMQSARVAATASIEDRSGQPLNGLLEDPSCTDPVGSAEWGEMKDLLAACIHKLPEQEKTVITLYYGEELLLKEIGEILKVTESRVSQIHSRALYRLNRELLSAGVTR